VGEILRSYAAVYAAAGKRDVPLAPADIRLVRPALALALLISELSCLANCAKFNGLAIWPFMPGQPRAFAVFRENVGGQGDDGDGISCPATSLSNQFCGGKNRPFLAFHSPNPGIRSLDHRLCLKALPAGRSAPPYWY